MPRKPPERNVDPEVSFSWPGQRRREDSGVVDVRLAARAQRQAQRQPDTDEQRHENPQFAPQGPPPTARAQPPATRSQTTASSARERWIVTELRRQAVTTDAALRDMA